VPRSNKKAAASQHITRRNSAWQMPICIENRARSAGKLGRPAVKLCRVHQHNSPLPPYKPTNFATETRLAAETDVEARDSLIQALGGLRNRAAIPALAALIEDEDADSDTRWTAVESLGRIVRRRFLDKSDPVAAARDWIAAERKRKAK